MNIEFKRYSGRIHPWSWYYSPQGPETHEVLRWLYDTFGTPLRAGRWNSEGGWISFRDERDMLLFVLRWS